MPVLQLIFYDCSFVLLISGNFPGIRQSRFMSIKRLDHGDELCEESSDDGDHQWEFNRDRLTLGTRLVFVLLSVSLLKCCF